MEVLRVRLLIVVAPTHKYIPEGLVLVVVIASNSVNTFRQIRVYLCLEAQRQRRVRDY